MKHPVEWGWLAFLFVFLTASAALLWFVLERMDPYR